MTVAAQDITFQGHVADCDWRVV